MDTLGYYNEKIYRSRLDQGKGSTDYWTVRSVINEYHGAEPVVAHLCPEICGLYVEDAHSQLFAVRV